jgi:hypothetical protein
MTITRHHRTSLPSDLIVAGSAASCTSAHQHATLQLNTPKSPTLQPPRRSIRGTGVAHQPVNIIIPLRRPHHLGRSRPSTNAKSP